ncbi:MAG: hypothetical protein L0322_29185 [Chloroflexi bacterium]|nr:hypothetical protein [Chloroflexota bacterium]MCI0575630.1 hypothetical protein [Chloroflexota bacterium]
MKLTPSERYVQELLQSRYGVFVHKIDEAGGSKGRTADFEFIKAHKRVFVCELKDFQRVEPSEEGGWTITDHPDGSKEAFKVSNAPTRISKHISVAYDQLSKYSEPKVLIFLDHGSMDYRDLEETYRGYSILEIGNIKIRNTYAKRASEGNIKAIKSRIDLYIWIDSSGSRIDLQEDRVTFLFVSEIGRKIAMEHFGITDDAA